RAAWRRWRTRGRARPNPEASALRCTWVGDSGAAFARLDRRRRGGSHAFIVARRRRGASDRRRSGEEAAHAQRHRRAGAGQRLEGDSGGRPAGHGPQGRPLIHPKPVGPTSPIATAALGSAATSRRTPAPAASSTPLSARPRAILTATSLWSAG